MKNVLIIGASRGIGLHTATVLKNEHHVFAIARHKSEELEALNVPFYQVDVVNGDLDTITDVPTELNGLVYCPGSINLKPFSRFTEKDFKEDFEQNLLGAVRCIQHFLPALKKAGESSIVLFSTVAVKVGMPFHASVAAAKGAVEGFARSIAAELAGSNIRVNVIAPSLTDTPLAAGLLNTDQKKEAAAERHPLKRIGSVNDIAGMVKFLLSDESSWITGSVLPVDGGLGALKP